MVASTFTNERSFAATGCFGVGDADDRLLRPFVYLYEVSIGSGLGVVREAARLLAVAMVSSSTRSSPLPLGSRDGASKCSAAAAAPAAASCEVAYVVLKATSPFTRTKSSAPTVFRCRGRALLKSSVPNMIIGRKYSR
jgi:hypothetical protein